jgi:hypothetical protein
MASEAVTGKKRNQIWCMVNHHSFSSYFLLFKPNLLLLFDFIVFFSVYDIDNT